MHELWEYSLSVMDHFFFWFGGIALVLVEIVRKTKWKEWAERLRWEFWLLASLCLFIATFQAWHEEREKSKAATVYLVADPPQLVVEPVNPQTFPVGKKPEVNLMWGVFGQHPALKVEVGLICYIKDNAGLSSQDSAIQDFKDNWAKKVEHLDRKENPSIFPGDAHHGGTCDAYNPISDDTRKQIIHGEKIVIIIGAVRFNDSMGVHDAHACKWLETHPSGPQELVGTVAWHECHAYTTQVDISD